MDALLVMAPAALPDAFDGRLEPRRRPPPSASLFLYGGRRAAHGGPRVAASLRASRAKGSTGCNTEASSGQLDAAAPLKGPPKELQTCGMPYGLKGRGDPRSMASG